MPDNVKEVAQALPFMISAASAAHMGSEENAVINKTRVVEAVIIAALTGALGMAGAWFLLVPELKLGLQHMERAVIQVQADVGQLRTAVGKLQVDVVNDRFRRSDFERYQDRHNAEHRDHLKHHQGSGH